jgi:hypothetical protein
MFARKTNDPSTLGTLVFLLWGLIVWGLQFTALYVLHTWFCALGAPGSATVVVSGALTAIAVALIAPVALAPASAGRMRPVGLRRDDSDGRHLVLIARVVGILAIVAALWSGATVAFVQACALGR